MLTFLRYLWATLALTSLVLWFYDRFGPRPTPQEVERIIQASWPGRMTDDR